MAATSACAVAASPSRKPGLAARAWRAAAAAAAAVALMPSPSPGGRGAIDDPTGRTVLQVSFRDQPTYEDLAETQAALSRAATILCDATEGQVRIAQIRLTSSPASEDLAALWLHSGDAASGGPYDAGGADLHRLGAHMDVFGSARLRPDRLAHLLGHHAFGLGDQYDDQRRRGSSCGVGPGFEPGQLDERNHSLMQGAGGMRCVEGPLVGQDCLRDDECGSSSCRAVLASELSTTANHDLQRGDGSACPRPSPVSRIRIGGLLTAKSEPIRAFDPRDFLTARASSVWHQELVVTGSSGTLPGVRLQLYLSHTARLAWQLTVAADAGEFGGTRGAFLPLRAWTLQFNENFSLGSVHPDDLRLRLPPTDGRGPLEVAIDIGSRNPDARGFGPGFDGFQMVAAGTTNVRVSAEGAVLGCDAPWCAASWSSARSRWELTEQSILHGGASDWQTLTRNLPFLMQPREIAADPPVVCQTPVQFFADVMGADQVVFVLDTSKTMGLRVDGKAGEVCGNATDDDGDGQSDEADCADSRLEYQRTAVRAFLALAAERKLQIGLVAMHTDAEIASEVQDSGGGRRAVLGAVLGSLVAEGDTAVGTAMERAQDALAKVERLGRSRSVILMSDGVRNVGVAAGQEQSKLDPLLYRVFTIGIGHAADGLGLAALAARSGGVAFSAPHPASMPAILAELAARHAGNALLLPRTAFDLAPAGADAAAAKLPASRELELSVEAKTRELVVYLGSRNDRIDDWRLLFELRAPDGERFDDSDPQNHVERGFNVVRISDPRPGRWTLRMLPGGRGVQRSEVLAYGTQDQAELFVDADPRLATVQRAVHLSARPAYVSGIDGDVSIAGSVRRPDGSEVPVVLARDPITQDWGTSFDQWAGRGLYEVRVHALVGEGAQPALGEPIFPGPPRALVRVVPFERYATATFFLADGPPPPCTLDDCDADGLPDKKEAGCPEDADGDGSPNRFDADSDNDEILDGEDGAGDADSDGVPNFCDAEVTPDSLSVVIEAEEAASAVACGADAAAGADKLRASLSAVRRIVQVMRTRAGIPNEVRADVVKSLEKVIELKKQAVVIADVLPEFCQKYQARLEEALTIERQLRVRVDPYLVR